MPVGAFHNWRLMMEAFWTWMLDRAMEKTTWIGFAALILGVVGIEAKAVQVEQVAGALTSLIGAILAVIPEHKKPE